MPLCPLAGASGQPRCVSERSSAVSISCGPPCRDRAGLGGQPRRARAPASRGRRNGGRGPPSSGRCNPPTGRAWRSSGTIERGPRPGPPRARRRSTARRRRTGRPRLPTDRETVRTVGVLHRPRDDLHGETGKAGCDLRLDAGLGRLRHGRERVAAAAGLTRDGDLHPVGLCGGASLERDLLTEPVQVIPLPHLRDLARAGRQHCNGRPLPDA